MAGCDEALPLTAFLPAIPAEATQRDLRCRAAVASTLLAGLELARNGMLTVEQTEAEGPVRFSRAPGWDAAFAGSASRSTA
jgi:segregation and condensation protein A